MRSELRGSTTNSLTPVYLSISRIRFQLLPPSRLRYRPRSPPSLHSGPWAATSTCLESAGSIQIWLMCPESFRPICVQLTPPSTDL